jgi:3-deoxy-D-manno-octulosonic-acid transferase
VKEFVLGLLSSIFVSEIIGWLPTVSRCIIRGATRLLPADNRDRFADEWNAEIDVLERSDRKVSTLLWALRVFIEAPRTGRILRAAYASPRKESFSLTILYSFYQLATAAALLAAYPFVLARRGSHYLPTLAGRLGKSAGATKVTGGLWLHAVSVRELSIAASLARTLPKHLPLLVTTVTPTGQEMARKLFPLDGRLVEVAYLPFELGFAVRRFYDRFAPQALILIEGDYWPLILHEAHRRSLPVAVVNGRVGDKSFVRLRRLRPALGPLFSRINRFGVQAEEDRARLVTLGVAPERITVTGNLIYESSEPPRRPELEAAILSLAAGRPILIAGSTMAGEEEQVLTAHKIIGGGARTLLILAPRHPERWAEVEAFLHTRGIAAIRRSTLQAVGVQRPTVLLLDSLGELASLYRLATAIFIGGTLVPTGGQNPLEAVRSGVPVAVGASMHNFREISDRFDRVDAWRRVTDAYTHGEVWKEWLDKPATARDQGARGARVFAENRGALPRTLEMLEGLWGNSGSILDDET